MRSFTATAPPSVATPLSGIPEASIDGRRPIARSTSPLSTAFPSDSVVAAPFPLTSIDSTFVPTRTSTPDFRKAAFRIRAALGSSPGRISGSISTTVTERPIVE